MNRRRYQRLVLIYMVACILWVVGSDWLLASLISDDALAASVSAAKGAVFVIAMSGLLYVLLMRLNRAEIKAGRVDMSNQMLLDKIPRFFSAVPVIIYAIEIHEKRHRTLWVSENIQRILGYSIDDAMEAEWWEQKIHPDDRLRVLGTAEEIYRNGGGDQKYRVLHKDGHYVTVHDEIKAIQNGEGPQRYIGVWADVSKEHLAETRIETYSHQLERSIFGTISSVSKMVELRDPYTAGHEQRVGNIAAKIADEMGLDENVQYALRMAGLVHDIGKISIPSEYLTKPTRLTEHEYNILKTHAEHGYEILRNVDFPWPIADVAHQHHERMDGSGYPRGLKGDEIILEARIIAVADVIESMATPRPYRATLGLNKALKEIEDNAGRLYDAEVAAAALRLFREKGYNLSLAGQTVKA